MKKIWKDYKIWLFLIVIFAGVLRFYHLDKIPVSPYWDEVSIGYNAYSIAQTGKDEHGVAFPFLFQAFNDYKLPGAVYLTALIVKFFGLNEITTRFTSAFLGTITVFLLYFLTKELLSLTKLKEKTIDIIGLLACFSLAISPWHIQFSRAEFEANSAVCFLVLGVIFLLRGIRGKIKSFFAAMVILPLACTFYRSVYIFLPLLLLSFVGIFRAEIFIKQFYWQKIIGISIFLVFFLPSVFFLVSSNGLIRSQQVSIFSNSFDQTYNGAKKIDSNPSLLNKIIYNRRVVYLSLFLDGYIKHFSPQFLFLEGDGNLRQSIVGMGMLYLYELPFLLCGVYYLFRLSKKIFAFITIWILLAPIPAALSVPNPHALRSLNMLPMPQLLVAIGIVWLFIRLQTVTVRFLTGVILVCIIFVSFYHYLFQYYVVTPAYANRDWGDGYKQLTSYVFAHEQNYDKIVISGYNWQPYIYFLFYKKYDPSLFQNYGSNKGFDKYIFGGTSWDKDNYSLTLDNVDLKKMSNAQKVLVALSPQEFALQKNNIQKIVEIKNSRNESVYILGNLK